MVAVAILLAILILQSLQGSTGFSRRLAPAYTTHAPILIASDADFTPANGVVGGTGTPGDPFVIAGWEIDTSTANAIDVRNTRANFVLRNISAVKSDPGAPSNYAVYLANVTDAQAEYVNTADGVAGITVRNSDRVHVAHVNATAADFDRSNHVGVTASVFRGFGISVTGGSNVTVSTNHVLGPNGSIWVRSMTAVVVDSNVLNGPGVIVNSTRDAAITGNRITGGQITLCCGPNDQIMISGNEIGGGWEGLAAIAASNVTIQGNNFSAIARSAIRLEGSFAVNVLMNRISDSGTGITVRWGTHDVSIRHNGFAGNQVQAIVDTATSIMWDDGYPSGGNFWSDYTGVDNCSGPNQDVCPDPDGIGDTPYTIDANNSDRYPLIHLPGNDTVPPSVSIVAPTEGSVFHASPITVSGTASDSGGSGLQMVEVRVNGGAWAIASGRSSWHTSVDLQPGADAIEARASDAAGNPSAIAQVNVTYNAPPPPPDAPPYANFSWTPPSPDTETPVNFTAHVADDRDPPDAVQVRWDWESDGAWDTTWSVAKTAQHLFTVAGTYSVTLEAMDTSGLTSNRTDSVLVAEAPPPPPPPANTPPYANFSWTPASGDASTVFTFTSTSSDAQDPPSQLQVRWDWESDGIWDTPWSNVAMEQHQFAAPASYNVTMEVQDTGGLTANRTATVVVTPVPPPPPPPLAAEINATPTEGTMPLTVSFASAVTGGVSPYSYDWEFGDGSKSNAANTVHIYITGGNFTVWLNVDDNGGTSVQSAFLFVNVTPAAVNLTVTPPTRFVEDSTGISVDFTASVTGGTPPYTYHWDFGDGGQSDAPNPIHMYATTGTYRVSVTVTDAQGQSVTRTFEFVVPPHSIPPSGGDGSLTPFVLAAAIAVAAVFAALWWNERRKGRVPPDPPRP